MTPSRTSPRSSRSAGHPSSSTANASTRASPGASVPKRSVAVVPFGARSSDPRAGAWGRQIARRLVDRFAEHADLELKPVFLVAMGDKASDAGYLVFGSTPDTALAAQYGASLGTSHALTGVLRANGERALEVTLVDVASKTVIETFTRPLGPGALPEAEPALATWLATSLDAEPPGPSAQPNETAYAALLEGMDEEVNATLLAASDASGSAAARTRAAKRYVDAVRADPTAAAAEERLLVLAAESIERSDEAAMIEPLEELTAIVPRSWRGHYLLGELRRLTGDANGAVVALEHADSLQPLRDADSVRLAELYVEADADATARSRLRRIQPASSRSGSSGGARPRSRGPTISSTARGRSSRRSSRLTPTSGRRTSRSGSSPDGAATSPLRSDRCAGCSSSGRISPTRCTSSGSRSSWPSGPRMRSGSSMRRRAFVPTTPAISRTRASRSCGRATFKRHASGSCSRASSTTPTRSPRRTSWSWPGSKTRGGRTDGEAGGRGRRRVRRLAPRAAPRAHPSAGRGRPHAHRSEQLPPLHPAALPGRDRRAAAARGRVPAAAPDRARATAVRADRGRGCRSRAACGPHRGRRLRVRPPRPRTREADESLRHPP